jgi:hypothetical protein
MSASPISESSTSLTIPVLRCAMIGLVLGSTVGAETVQAKSAQIVYHCDDTKTDHNFIPISSDGSECDGATHEQVANSLMRTFSRHGLIADRRNKTVDGSILLEFITGRKACVDIYPTGEIVVIVKESGSDNVFEFGIADIDRILELVRDGFRE